MTGEELKKLRLNARLSQRELAERVGLSRYYIHRLEAGKSAISPTIALALAHVFDLKGGAIGPTQA